MSLFCTLGLLDSCLTPIYLNLHVESHLASILLRLATAGHHVHQNSRGRVWWHHEVVGPEYRRRWRNMRRRHQQYVCPCRGHDGGLRRLRHLSYVAHDLRHLHLQVFAVALVPG